MFTDPLVNTIHRLMPGLRTEAALLGTLAWMLVARLAQVLVDVWASLTPQGRAAQAAERAALHAEVQAEVDAVMQALAKTGASGPPRQGPP